MDIDHSHTKHFLILLVISLYHMEFIKLTFEVQQINALDQENHLTPIPHRLPWLQTALKTANHSPSANKLSLIFFATNIRRTCIHYFISNSAEMTNSAVEIRNIVLKIGKTPPQSPLPVSRVSPELTLPLVTSADQCIHEHTQRNLPSRSL